MTDIETTENVFEAKARQIFEKIMTISDVISVGHRVTVTCERKKLVSAIASALEAEMRDRLAAKDARIASLEAGLKPFAAEAEKWSSEIHFSDLTPALDILGSACNNCGDDPGYETAAFTIGDLRRARTLLEGKDNA